MSPMFSTSGRTDAGERVFSSRRSEVTILPQGKGPGPGRVRVTLLPPAFLAPAAAPGWPAGGRPLIPAGPAAAPPPPTLPVASAPLLAPPQPTLPAAGVPMAAPQPVLRITLGSDGAPAFGLAGTGCAGWVHANPAREGSFRIEAEVTGFGGLADPAVIPVLWLVWDLKVPASLAEADAAALPRAAGGTGNRPGEIYTSDGSPPRYLSDPNTLSLSVSPGALARAGEGRWWLSGQCDRDAKRTYHPLAVLGPAWLADINEAVPAGLTARILTDLYMRPATVHPELRLVERFEQRLAAVVRDALTEGRAEPWEGFPFAWAAVTLEGPVRTTPWLMPTTAACILRSQPLNR